MRERVAARFLEDGGFLERVEIVGDVGIFVRNEIFIDSDCLSAFLWVGEERLLFEAVGRVFVPREVYFELCHPSIAQLRARLDGMIAHGWAEIAALDEGEAREYARLVAGFEESDFWRVGGGEAACLVLARFRGGVIASNNFADVRGYVARHRLSHTTTAMILAGAYDAGIIGILEGDAIWRRMLTKRRSLPGRSLTEFLGKRR